MDYQRITLELPPLTDEVAASLQNFIYALMYAIDEHYYKQIHHYHLNKLNDMLVDADFTQENLDDPPF